MPSLIYSEDIHGKEPATTLPCHVAKVTAAAPRSAGLADSTRQSMVPSDGPEEMDI